MYERTRISQEERESAKRQNASGTVQTEATWEAPGVSFNPRVLNPTTVLQMQQKYGNAAVQRMLAKYRPRRAPAVVIRRQDEEETASSEQPTGEVEYTSPEGEYTPDTESTEQPVGEEGYSPEGESEAQAEDQSATDEGDTEAEAEGEEAPESEADTENATDENADSDDEHTRDIEIEGEPRTVTVQGSATGRTSSVLEVGATTTATYSGDLVSKAMVKGDPPNVNVSGTATCTYTVDCKVDMPTPPSNLEGCEKREYQKAIDTMLRKHEDEHVRRFKTYEGTTTHQFSEKVADENDIDAILDKKFLKPNVDTRSAAADTLSGKIDPFTFKADLSACDSPNKKV